LVFHSNHLKICVGEAFIKGIHSCQKIKFWIKLFLNYESNVKCCDVPL
jgi:hypothetical protein